MRTDDPSAATRRLTVALCSGDETLFATLGALGVKTSRVTVDSLETALHNDTSAMLLDADAPGMLAAIQKLRRAHPPGRRPVVVVVTSHGERMELQALRPDVILPRMLSAHDMAARMQNLVAAPPRLEPSTPRPSPPPRLSSPSHSAITLSDGLSAPLLSLLRASVADMGGDISVLEIPSLGESSLDELVPPELLEPLDAALDAFDEESSRTTSDASFAAHRPNPARAAPTRGSQTSLLAPLQISGDLRYSGSLHRHALGLLLPAASRARCTGTLVLRAPGTPDTWHLALSAGHLMALRGSRHEDHIGPLLARLGYLPQEAARHSLSALDMGPRGAAGLCARGYISPDSLAPSLASAALELLSDLLCLPSTDWELRAAEAPVGIPLPTRSLDALLVLMARARVEPAEAYSILGGDGTTITQRGDPRSLAPLGLTQRERDAVASARNTLLAPWVRSHGDAVLPAMTALYWLGLLRAEGPSHESSDPSHEMHGAERSRLRVLTEAATRGDHLAMLGVSPWATRISAQTALGQRRRELEAMRARHPQSEAVAEILRALDGIEETFKNPTAWERFMLALR